MEFMSFEEWGISNFNFSAKDPSLLPYVYFGIDFGDELVPTQYSVAPYGAFMSQSQPPNGGGENASKGLQNEPVKVEFGTPVVEAMKKRKVVDVVAPSKAAVIEPSKSMKAATAVMEPEAAAPESAEGSETAPPKKQTPPRPCSVCKSVHVACDKKRPCSRCKRLGKEEFCVDPPFKKRGRRPLKDKRARTERKRSADHSDDDYETSEDDAEIEAHLHDHDDDDEAEYADPAAETKHKHSHPSVRTRRAKPAAATTENSTSPPAPSPQTTAAEAFRSNSAALMRNQINRPSANEERRFLAVTDSNGNFVSVTREFASLLGYQPAELVGAQSSELHPTELRSLYSSFMRMMLDTAAANDDYITYVDETLWTRRSGSRLMLTCEYTVRLRGGAPIDVSLRVLSVTIDGSGISPIPPADFLEQEKQLQKVSSTITGSSSLSPIGIKAASVSLSFSPPTAGTSASVGAWDALEESTSFYAPELSNVVLTNIATGVSSVADSLVSSID